MLASKTINLILISAALIQIHCSSPRAQNAQQVESLNSRGIQKKRVSPISNIDTDRIQHLISLLFSNKREERDKAQKELVAFAQESSQNRETVIDKLTISAEKLNLKDKWVLDVATFQFWSGACHIFSNLKAIEAIDLLIRFIHCSDGLTDTTPGHIPAEDALIAIGSIGVPKLSEALLLDQDNFHRKRIALCLGNIGGTEAKQGLERARQTETNREVIHSIDLALSNINSKAL